MLAPAAGLLTYLSWTSVEFGSFTKPLTLQTDPTRHGGLTDPVVTLYHDAVNLLGGHHVGTDLHLPWVAVTVAMLIVVFRRLPVSYGLYSAAIVVVAASGSNLDSFERYALSAFPLLMGGGHAAAVTAGGDHRAGAVCGDHVRLRLAGLPGRLRALSPCADRESGRQIRGLRRQPIGGTALAAEREGFEPSDPVTQVNSLAVSPIRPLSHLS